MSDKGRRWTGVAVCGVRQVFGAGGPAERSVALVFFFSDETVPDGW